MYPIGDLRRLVRYRMVPSRAWPSPRRWSPRPLRIGLSRTNSRSSSSSVGLLGDLQSVVRLVQSMSNDAVQRPGARDLRPAR